MERCFSCQMCSHCCSGEPGYVFLSLEDIRRASGYLEVKEEEFLSIYCRKLDYGTYYIYSLKERDDFSCIFLSEKGCTIYPSRPLQCSTYPFWKGLFDDDEAWEREKRSCPGIDVGRIYSESEMNALSTMTVENDIYKELKEGDDSLSY